MRKYIQYMWLGLGFVNIIIWRDNAAGIGCFVLAKLYQDSY